MAAQHLVLIVDDEEAYRLSVVDGLARCADRFRVLTASDGREALEVIARENPSLVVSDIRMPRMDGIELLLTSRKRYPNVPFILVSAYFSEGLQRSARTFGAARILHKPLDLDVLIDAITGVLTASHQKGHSQPPDGFLPAFSLPGFLQLVAMEQKTCALKLVNAKGGTGILWIEKGRLVDAEHGSLWGTPAALQLLTWDNPDITLQPFQRAREDRIAEGLQFLIMESARLRDETGEPEPAVQEMAQAAPPNAPSVELFSQAPTSPGLITSPNVMQTHKEHLMSGMEEVLKKLKDVTGFVAVGAFTPQGEMIAHVANSGVAIGEIGALANDVLLKAQKATDVMNVGRGNFVIVNAPRAIIMMRCLNENTDFSVSEPGRAHVHCALILEPEGNVGLAKMQLEKVVQEVAPHVR